MRSCVYVYVNARGRCRTSVVYRGRYVDQESQARSLIKRAPKESLAPRSCTSVSLFLAPAEPTDKGRDKTWGGVRIVRTEAVDYVPGK